MDQEAEGANAEQHRQHGDHGRAQHNRGRWHRHLPVQAGAAGRIAPHAPLVVRDGRRVARRWHADRHLAQGLVLRTYHGAVGHPPGIRSSRGSPGCHHSVPWIGQLLAMGRGHQTQLAAAAARLQAPADQAGCVERPSRHLHGHHHRHAGDVPDDRTATRGQPWRVRDQPVHNRQRHSDRPALATRCGCRNAAPRRPVVRNAGRSERRHRHHAAAVQHPRLHGQHRRKAGGHDRLFRFREGRRSAGRQLGAVRDAGSAGQALAGDGRRPDLLPRQGRDRRSRRQPADLPGNLGACAGHHQRQVPRHRTGRDDHPELRVQGSRRTHHGHLHGRGARREAGGSGQADPRMAPDDGTTLRRELRRVPSGRARRRSFRPVLSLGDARAGAVQPQHRIAAGQAQGHRRRGEPARHPVELFVDPDPSEPAHLAWGGAGRRRSPELRPS
mmetsp:Transcript_1371/g.3384  ORF Transcript_1371/g.3384 Transcript_1371/m.3384 type:complete len:442 (-) Transcript_1371:770-2095(-)